MKLIQSSRNHFHAYPVGCLISDFMLTSDTATATAAAMPLSRLVILLELRFDNIRTVKYYFQLSANSTFH